MKIDINQITSGELLGEIIYVSDYRKPDLDKKAIRHVEPIRVIVCNEKTFNDAGKKYPNVYYSHTVLVPLNKKDEPVFSRPIKVFDNTGFRAFTGVPLQAFSTEEEAIDSYNEQVQSVIDRYQHAILTAPMHLISEQEDIKKFLIRKTDD